MAAPVIVQTCWRGHRTPAGVAAQVLHMGCNVTKPPPGYGSVLAGAWWGRGDLDAPGLWVIEHDVAVDPGDAAAMLAQIAATPTQVVAAPYLCWPVSTRLTEPFTLPDTHHGRARFGLGCTFLPAQLLNTAGRRLEAWTYPTVDAELSTLAHLTGITVHPLRGAHVKHLHY